LIPHPTPPRPIDFAIAVRLARLLHDTCATPNALRSGDGDLREICAVLLKEMQMLLYRAAPSNFERPSLLRELGYAYATFGDESAE